MKAAKRWTERVTIRKENLAKLETEGPQSVETPGRIQRFNKRASGANLLKATNPGTLPLDIRAERILGVDNRRKFPANAVQQKAAIPVARVVIMHGPGIAPQGFGTGFMISPELLMTNHHVVGTASDASGVGANFGHDFVPGGGVRDGEIFELDADTFFAADEALDFAVIAVKRKSLNGADISTYGHHPLIRETGKILLGNNVNIIQHPMGGGKKYATEGNGLIDRLENFLHYQTDTEPGSSGSPAFNDFWEVVALHHSSVPRTRDGVILNVDGQPWNHTQGDSQVDWIANEGVRISRILAALRNQDLNNPASDALRDRMLALGTQAQDAAGSGSEIVGDAGAAIIGGPSVQTTTTDGSAPNTVVHVHGPANVYTGNVVNHGPAEPGGTMTAVSPESLDGPLVHERRLRFDPHYGRRRGYQSNFLRDFDISLPTIASKRDGEMVKDRHGNALVLDYHHYSLVMNKRWLLQMWSAVNVDYSPQVRWNISREEFGSDTWIHDPRISEALQIDNEELYAPAKKFDRGHVVRRVDSAWGATREEVVFANSDTFHWTNCTPQHENFNRSNRRGLWGKLENHITEQADAVDNRMILFSGPVLNKKRAIPHDFGGGKFLVPLDFWKVVVLAETKRGSPKSELRAYGFLLEQKTAIDTKGLEKLSTAERFEVGDFEAQQRPLATIQKMSDVVFPDNVLKADVMFKASGNSKLK
ncbi:MAG: DNA/RNA non-specific endonuclease, partial [Pseudomonadota bacterium]